MILGGCNDIGELGKFWANDLPEIMDALKVIDELHERINAIRGSFDTNLAMIVSKIAAHFEMHETSGSAE